MQRLITVIMGQNCEKFIKMCLESVKDADAIVYIDGGSEDNTFNYLKDFHGEGTGSIDSYDHDRREWTRGIIPTKWMIHREYNQENKGMNGIQRNHYLKFVKEKYPDDWCLVLDADEVVDDLNE